MGTEIKLHHNMVEVFKDIELWDSRFINCCLLGTNQKIIFKKEDYYPVDIRMYAKQSGMSEIQAFTRVEETVLKLKELDIKVKLPDNRILHTSLIYSFIVDVASRTININWNKNFIPLISGRMEAGNFLMLDTKASTISSNRRYCLYVLLQKYLWKLPIDGAFYIEKQEIRAMIGLKETEYAEYKALNKWVVKPTLADIHNKLGIGLQAKVLGSKVRFTYAV